MTFYRIPSGWSGDGHTFKNVAECLDYSRRYWGVPVRCFFVRGEYKVDLA